MVCCKTTKAGVDVGSALLAVVFRSTTKKIHWNEKKSYFLPFSWNIIELSFLQIQTLKIHIRPKKPKVIMNCIPFVSFTHFFNLVSVRLFVRGNNFWLPRKQKSRTGEELQEFKTSRLTSEIHAICWKLAPDFVAKYKISSAIILSHAWVACFPSLWLWGTYLSIPHRGVGVFDNN